MLLNRYFYDSPYNWFNSFNEVLNGMGCTYGGRMGSSNDIALHTDICTPLATAKAWNDIPKQYRENLKEEGNKIWEELVEQLSPNIIVCSIPQYYLSNLSKINVGKLQELCSIHDKKGNEPRKKPFVLKKTTIKINDHNVLLVNGPCVNVPFGSISNDQKRSLGKIILQDYNNYRT